MQTIEKEILEKTKEGLLRKIKTNNKNTKTISDEEQKKIIEQDPERVFTMFVPSRENIEYAIKIAKNKAFFLTGLSYIYENGEDNIEYNSILKDLIINDFDINLIKKINHNLFKDKDIKEKILEKSIKDESIYQEVLQKLSILKLDNIIKDYTGSVKVLKENQINNIGIEEFLNNLKKNYFNINTFNILSKIKFKEKNIKIEQLNFYINNQDFVNKNLNDVIEIINYTNNPNDKEEILFEISKNENASIKILEELSKNIENKKFKQEIIKKMQNIDNLAKEEIEKINNLTIENINKNFIPENKKLIISNFYSNKFINNMTYKEINKLNNFLNEYIQKFNISKKEEIFDIFSLDLIKQTIKTRKEDISYDQFNSFYKNSYIIPIENLIKKENTFKVLMENEIYNNTIREQIIENLKSGQIVDFLTMISLANHLTNEDIYNISILDNIRLGTNTTIVFNDMTVNQEYKDKTYDFLNSIGSNEKLNIIKNNIDIVSVIPTNKEEFIHKGLIELIVENPNIIKEIKKNHVKQNFENFKSIFTKNFNEINIILNNIISEKILKNEIENINPIIFEEISMTPELLLDLHVINKMEILKNNKPKLDEKTQGLVVTMNPEYIKYIGNPVKQVIELALFKMPSILDEKYNIFSNNKIKEIVEKEPEILKIAIEKDFELGINYLNKNANEKNIKTLSPIIEKSFYKKMENEEKTKEEIRKIKKEIFKNSNVKLYGTSYKNQNFKI